MDDDPLLKLISPLAGVVLAVVLSILVSATVAGQIGADYATRAWIYTIAVLWALVGAVVVFMLAHRGETKTLSGPRTAVDRQHLAVAGVRAARHAAPRRRHAARVTRGGAAQVSRVSSPSRSAWSRTTAARSRGRCW